MLSVVFQSGGKKNQVNARRPGKIALAKYMEERRAFAGLREFTRHRIDLNGGFPGVVECWITNPRSPGAFLFVEVAPPPETLPAGFP